MGLSYLATNPEGQRWVITRENTENKKNESYFLCFHPLN